MRYTLVLDAMGVIFASADDVAELLRPFIAARGGRHDPHIVDDLYTRASLGQLAPNEFWQGVDLDPSLEDEYLALHRLTDGLIDFLSDGSLQLASVWCLSNDVGQWSRKLRQQFKLSDHLAGAVISGDVGSRKPDQAIYKTLLSQIGMPADHVVFVDDRPKNLAPARELGIRTIHFGVPEVSPIADFNVESFAELAELLRRSAHNLARPVKLHTPGGNGLQPGVDLSRNAALQDLMDQHNRRS